MDKRPQYRITLVNKDLATRTQTTIGAFCFAEAASQAYLLKNNRNQGIQSGQGWWKIHSISETGTAREYKTERTTHLADAAYNRLTQPDSSEGEE